MWLLPFLLSKEKEPLEALKYEKGTRNIHNLSQVALGAKVLIKGILHISNLSDRSYHCVTLMEIL